jgi:hypothetical protein
MEQVYKGYFLSRLQKLLLQQKIKTVDAAALAATITKLAQVRWNVHAKAPFGGPAQILEYLGRYTHYLSRTCFGKTAITAHRVKKITHREITFTYKDYRSAGTKKEMTLSHEEFARRFEQHNLSRTAGRDFTQAVCKNTAWWLPGTQWQKGAYSGHTPATQPAAAHAPGHHTL